MTAPRVSSSPAHTVHPTEHVEGGSILSGGPALPSSGIALFLIQLVLVLLVTRVLSGILKKLKQPGVVAEILGGILLGPSLLGAIPGYLPNLFPATSMEPFALVADFGLVLYLFLVGIELEPAELLKTGPTALFIAISGIVVPFGLGALVSILLYHQILAKDPEYADVPLSSLAVFTGVGMSITAFPVLARILTETKLISVPLGQLALSAAAFNDAVAWCLLAVAIALVQAGRPIFALYIFLLMALYTVFLFLVVRPLLNLAVQHVNATRSRSWRNALLALVFVCIFLSGWFTQVLGLDAIFGAFLIGVILPRDEALVKVVEKIEDIVMVVFLPMYFTLSGLQTDVGSLGGGRVLGIFILILFLAVAGKFIGCTGAAMLAGLPRRESLSIGALMNTRGLVELIVLNLGLRAKVINVQIFTIMVLMALLTTVMTTPLIRHLYPKSLWATSQAEKAKDNFGRRVSRMQSLSPRLRELSVLVPADESKSIVLALYLLLPAQANPRAKVITAVMQDAMTTSSVMDQRIVERTGKVNDPDAREISLAAQLFGADVGVETVVSPEANMSTLLMQLMHRRDVDMCVLPWTRRYEAAARELVSKVAGSVVLFHDAGRSVPNVLHLLRPSPGREGSRSCEVVCVVLDFDRDERAVMDLAERLSRRSDVQVVVCTYQGTSDQAVHLAGRQSSTPHAIGSDTDFASLIRAEHISTLLYQSDSFSLGQADKHTARSSRTGPHRRSPLTRAFSFRRGDSADAGSLEHPLVEDDGNDENSAGSHEEHDVAHSHAIDADHVSVQHLVARALRRLQGQPVALMEVHVGGLWASDFDGNDHQPADAAGGGLSTISHS